MWDECGMAGADLISCHRMWRIDPDTYQGYPHPLSVLDIEISLSKEVT